MNIDNYNEYYVQGSDHYLIPKHEFREIFRELEKLKNDNKHLNMQLDRALDDLEEEQMKNEKNIIIYYKLKNNRYMISTVKDFSDVLDLISENVISDFYNGDIKKYIKENCCNTDFIKEG